MVAIHDFRHMFDADAIENSLFDFVQVRRGMSDNMFDPEVARGFQTYR